MLGAGISRGISLCRDLVGVDCREGGRLGVWKSWRSEAVWGRGPRLSCGRDVLRESCPYWWGLIKIGIFVGPLQGGGFTTDLGRGRGRVGVGCRPSKAASTGSSWPSLVEEDISSTACDRGSVSI